MFEFDIDDGTLGPKRVHGKILREIVDYLHEKDFDNCWVLINEESGNNNPSMLSRKTSYYNYLLGCLSLMGYKQVRVNDKGSAQNNMLLFLIEELKKSIKKSTHYSSKKSLGDISDPNTGAVKLIQRYTESIGPLIFDLGNIAALSETERSFFVDLKSQVSKKVCFVAISSHNESSKIPNNTIFRVDVAAVIRHIIKKLVRLSFDLKRESEKQLIKFVLSDPTATSIADASFLITNIALVSMRDYAVQLHLTHRLKDINIDYVTRYYLSVPKKEMPVFASKFESSPILENVSLLCCILGPYIKLETLKIAYPICFNGDEYPSDIDYSKISLLCNKGHIRFLDIHAYDAALSQNSNTKRKQILRIVNKIAGVAHNTAIKTHLEELYDTRNLLPKVMEIRIHKTIIKLYGFNTDKNAQAETQGLSGSSERMLGDSEHVGKSEAHYTKKDLELIINCFNELICFFCAKQDLASAFNYCRYIAEFLEAFHADNYQFNMTDLDLIEMVSHRKTTAKKQKPYGLLPSSLHDPVISILSNLCMVSYFLSNYLSIRKYIGYAYLLQSEDSEYKPVIEACIGIILTQSAESLLRSYINSVIDYPIENPTLPNHELELYYKLRQTASTFVSMARVKLLAKPMLSEQALAWSMFVIGGNFTLEYSRSSNYLRNAYQYGIRQKNYFKAILAFGNSILLEFCSGVTASALKKSCTDFINQCDEYGITMPKSIIKSLLDYANYSENSNEIPKDLNLEFSTEFSNHFFINFARLVLLFAAGNYSQCVYFAERMRQLEFQGEQDSSRVGYCIWRIYEWLEAVSLLRYLEDKQEQITDSRIKTIRYAENAFKIFAAEFPKNFDYWYDFLIAEISRSELSLKIINRQVLPINEQLSCYDKALESALLSGNVYCSHEISKVVKKIHALAFSQLNLTSKKTDIVDKTVLSFETAIKTGYDEKVAELVRITGSMLVILFIFNVKNKKCLPKLIYCCSKNVNDVVDAFDDELFSIDKPPEALVWHHPAVQQSAESNQLTYYSSQRCTKTPLFELNNVNNMMAIPIVNHRYVVGVLYSHGVKNLGELDQRKMQKYSSFAHEFFALVHADTRILRFVRFENKAFMARKKSAAHDKTVNASLSSNDSSLTSTGSASLFFGNIKRKNKSFERTNEASLTDEDAIRTDESTLVIVKPALQKSSSSTW